MVQVFATTVIGLAVPTLFIRNNICDLYGVHGPSMSPTLSPNAHDQGKIDHILALKMINLERRQGVNVFGKRDATYIRENDLKRGMVVTFWSPRDPEQMNIKRVIALEDDEVLPARPPHRDREADGTKFVRGPRNKGTPEERAALSPVKIPFGHVWVEGDNQDASLDSNDYGPISKSLIQGIAIAVVSPWERSGFREWEKDGWEKRLGSRIKRRNNELEDVPYEWAMHK